VKSAAALPTKQKAKAKIPTILAVFIVLSLSIEVPATVDTRTVFNVISQR
jgi:hypothetical protein